MTTSTIVIPLIHQNFINQVIINLKNDNRFDGLLGAGSIITNEIDEYSDVDLTLIVSNESFNQVMNERIKFAQQFEGYLNGFTGEHVGEPRLLICLYNRSLNDDQSQPQQQQQHLLHVDLKFIKFESLSELIEKPIVLWERNENENKIQNYIINKSVSWPNKESQWFEDRSWIWIHYGLTKVLRGELLESISMLTFFRDQILGPLISRRLLMNQRGVRKLELLPKEKQLLVSNEIQQLQLTIPKQNDKESILQSLKQCINLYLNLRNDDPPNNLTKNMPESLLNIINK